MVKSNGVIYYNTGDKCLARLLVSLHSLRKHEDCNVAILSQGEDSNKVCEKIAGAFDNVELIEVDYGVEEGKNKAYIEACLCHEATPFEITIWLDADTIIRKPFSQELFDYTEQHEFVISQFATWETHGGTIKKRIMEWKNIYPELIDGALNFGPAINCGVFAFKKDSEIMNVWYDMAEQGRDNFIADESCLQVFLHKFPHMILPDTSFNCSCKYDKTIKDAKIIHYHGRKHCRLDERGNPQFNSELWIKELEEVIENNTADIKSWLPGSDKYLRRYFNGKSKR